MTIIKEEMFKFFGSESMANAVTEMFMKTRTDNLVSGAYYFKELEALQVEWNVFVTTFGEVKDATEEQHENATRLLNLLHERKFLLDQLLGASGRKVREAENGLGVAA